MSKMLNEQDKNSFGENRHTKPFHVHRPKSAPALCQRHCLGDRRMVTAGFVGSETADTVDQRGSRNHVFNEQCAGFV